MNTIFSQMEEELQLWRKLKHYHLNQLEKLLCCNLVGNHLWIQHQISQKPLLLQKFSWHDSNSILFEMQMYQWYLPVKQKALWNIYFGKSSPLSLSTTISNVMYSVAFFFFFLHLLNLFEYMHSMVNTDNGKFDFFYLFRKSICSFWRIIPVFIMMVWKVCLSMAQILTSLSAAK